jgi:putative ABC transport system permease protein
VARLRIGLLAEVLSMAVDTLRTNKMRSALTVLGVVIGVTSIVGMTSLVRGFGKQFETMVRTMGADTVYVAKFSISSFASGKQFWDLMRRPDLTEEDAAALKLGVPSARHIGMQLGGGPGSQSQQISYRGTNTKSMQILGVTANFPETNYLELPVGRFFNEYEVQRRRNVVVLGASPAEVLFPNSDPIDKKVRIGAEEFTVIGVLGKRPALLGGNPDEFAVIPITTHDKLYDPPRLRGMKLRFMVIGVVPYEGVSRDRVLAEVEQVMRSRHRLRVDEENDFDLLTSDVLMRIFDQVTQAVALALVVISSIALMVGGIGVMAIMMISVTERTREIGVRKALGARRREILWQFLIEAAFLTSFGGVLGILFGSGIGLVIHWISEFPISLPWWSFAIGIGFSAGVGIFFGLFPAIKASRLDPIEALRYE